MATVEIVQRATEDEPEEVVETLTCATEREAEKVERGVNINLDHERFYTRIPEES